MKIQNHDDLLKKKNALKQIIYIQEEQLRNNMVSRTFTKAKSLTDNIYTNFGLHKDNQGDSLVEKGIDYALTALSANTFRNKKLGMPVKLAIGFGIIVIGKLLASKIAQWRSVQEQEEAILEAEDWETE